MSVSACAAFGLTTSTLTAIASDTVLGYTYTVTCSGFQGERLDVKIPRKQLLGEDAYDHLVKFSNIQLGIYPSYMKGQRGIDAVNLKAMAEGVTVIGG